MFTSISIYRVDMSKLYRGRLTATCETVKYRHHSMNDNSLFRCEIKVLFLFYAFLIIDMLI